ncbi:hypothetical protein D3C78_1738270 [compost metagenome]
MAQLVITYTSDGKILSELTYKGEKFSYTMIPDGYGKTSDKAGFEYQISDRFPDDEGVLEHIEELAWADEDEIGDILNSISDYED